MSHIYHDPAPPSAGQRVMLATTSYQDPAASYTFSIARTRQALSEAGIASDYLLLQGNCHVDDARNKVVAEFLKTDCTDLVFLDADVSWKPADLVTLCQYDLDLVGGVYPYRREDARATGRMPFVAIEGRYQPDKNGLLEVLGLPTGFMRIRRNVLETLASEADWPDGKMPILFERGGKPRLGGDLNFCRKWQEKGGKCHAATQFRLGHVVTKVVTDSLGASLRRMSDTTMAWAAQRLRDGSEDLSIFTEVYEYAGDLFSANEDALSASVFAARKADGPILECGSGLTTVLMAAVTDQPIYALEHEPYWAKRTHDLAKMAGVGGIKLATCPIVDGWYDLTGLDLPEHFALGVCDGPPRRLGDRIKFYGKMGHRCEQIVADDVDDPNYLNMLYAWTANSDYEFHRVGDRAAFIRRAA